MIRFGPFLLDPQSRQLWRDRQPLKLEKIPLDILILLVQRRDRIVSREEIAEAVWGRDRFVEAADGINTAIRKIRKALEDTAEEPKYIGTFVGRGYRFLAEVQNSPLEQHHPPSGEVLPAPQPAPKPSRGYRFLWCAGILIFTAAMATLLGLHSRQSPQTNDLPAIARLTSDNGFTGWPDLSPDGKLIAYASNRAGPDNQDIYIQPVAGGSAIRLTHDPGADIFPAISPQGDQIAFQSTRQPPGIYVMPIFGGTARLIARDGYRPRFSPDGKWIAFGKSDSSWIIPASGGEARQLRPELSSGWPIWAGNDHLIFIGQNDKNPMDWWLTPRDGSSAKALGVFPLLASQPIQDFPDSWQSSRTPDFYDNGSVVFRVRTRDGSNLWRIRFSGDWKPLSVNRVTAMADHVREPAASATGQLAAAVVSRNIDVYELPLDADTATVKGRPNRLTNGKTSEHFVSVSADGSLVSYTGWRKSDHGDQYILDTCTGVERQLTATDDKESAGRISPDGKFLIFGRWDPKGRPAFLKMTLASGETQTLCADCDYVDVTSDSASYIYNQRGTNHLLIRDLLGGAATEPVHDDSFFTTQASIAANKRWIAFAAVPRNERNSPPMIFVAPFRRDGRVSRQEWVEIAAGQTPLWSPNGHWLYFDEEHGSYRCLSARRFDPITGKPGPKTEIAHIHGDQKLISGWPVKDRGLARNRVIFATMETLSNIWLLR